MTIGELVAKLLTFDQNAVPVVEDSDGYQSGFTEIKEGFKVVNPSDGPLGHWMALNRDQEGPSGWEVRHDEPCVLFRVW